jgi:uncharacterized protein YegP (UPF0339 family)
MGKFELYTDAEGHFRWRLRATNGKIIADCGEGYVAKRDCEHGIELVKSLAAEAPVVEAEAA